MREAGAADWAVKDVDRLFWRIRLDRQKTFAGGLHALADLFWRFSALGTRRMFFHWVRARGGAHCDASQQDKPSRAAKSNSRRYTACRLSGIRQATGCAPGFEGQEEGAQPDFMRGYNQGRVTEREAYGAIVSPGTAILIG